MKKTTLYLDERLKRSLEIEASRRGSSEADVIRSALEQALPPTPPKPNGALFAGTTPIADRVDEILEGFGE